MIAKRSSHFTSLFLAIVALGCGPWSAGAAAAQPYPNRLIKLIVPFVAGAPIDIVRAGRRRQAVSQPQAAIRDRESAGRGRQHRNRSHRKISARRIHAGNAARQRL